MVNITTATAGQSRGSWVRILAVVAIFLLKVFHKTRMAPMIKKSMFESANIIFVLNPLGAEFKTSCIFLIGGSKGFLESDEKEVSNC